MYKWRSLVLVALALLILGCSTAGVMETNDPKVKMAQANELLKLNRPLAAEKMLHQALSIFQSQSNKEGEVEVNRRLGLFYSSPQYHGYADYYKKHNEYDPTNKKALEYFEKSKAQAEQIKNYYTASNASFLIAMVHRQWNDKETTCQHLTNAIELNKKGVIKEPNKDIGLPSQYSSYEEFIRKGYMADIGCN